MIGERIKKVREIKGYSLEYIAEELNIYQSAYSDLGNNKTKIDLQHLDIEKIAKVLETDIIKLLSKGEPKTFNNNQKSGVANNALVINQLSKQLIEQYEKRLIEKNESITVLKEPINR